MVVGHFRRAVGAPPIAAVVHALEMRIAHQHETGLLRSPVATCRTGPTPYFVSINLENPYL